MHVLVAADAAWLVDEIVAALGGTTTSFTVCSEGRDVVGVIEERLERGEPVDVGIFDLQIGSMGGIAVTMALRLDASAGVVPDVPVLVLLDRAADVHLARRSGADGWLIKPLDPLRLRRAVRTVLAGEPYEETLFGPPPRRRSRPSPDGASRPDDGAGPDATEAVAGSASEEPARTG